MAERILVPYDGGEHSRAALAYASGRFPEAELLVLHVIEPFPDHTRAGGHPGTKHAAVYERRRALLDDARQQVDDHRGSVTTDLVYGRTTAELPRYVERNAIDEVVMGSRGQEGLANLLLGSVSLAAIRRSPVPVTVVRPDDGGNISPPGSVLVPFDGSAPARDALRYAFEQFPDAEVTALFVYTAANGASVDIDSEADLEAAVEREGGGDAGDEHALAAAGRIANRQGRELNTATAHGDPVHALVRWTDEHDAEQLVVGRQGYSGVRRFLFGDTTESIVRRSLVPVTVVP